MSRENHLRKPERKVSLTFLTSSRVPSTSLLPSQTISTTIMLEAEVDSIHLLQALDKATTTTKITIMATMITTEGNSNSKMIPETSQKWILRPTWQLRRRNRCSQHLRREHQVPSRRSQRLIRNDLVKTVTIMKTAAMTTLLQARSQPLPWATNLYQRSAEANQSLAQLSRTTKMVMIGSQWLLQQARSHTNHPWLSSIRTPTIDSNHKLLYNIFYQ